MMTKWDETPRTGDQSVENFSWHDQAWLDQRATRYTSPVLPPLNIYELHPDTWMRDDQGAALSYHRMADELAPYAKQMGYTHVMLDSLPAVLSDGDLRAFVDILHTAGVGVILNVSSTQYDTNPTVCAPHVDGVHNRDSASLLMFRDQGNDAPCVAYARNHEWAAHTTACIQCDLFDGLRRRELLVNALHDATPRGVLAISERDVSGGAGSFLSKMPGDYWQKFAGVRLFAGWMMTCPGVKQCFMGTEIGQFDEWSPDRSVEWFLLDYDYHARLQHYFAALNRLYLTSPALWGSETHIIKDNVNDGVLVFSRRSDKHDRDLVVLLNPTPRAMERRDVQVPASGSYREIFNSDASEFGGSHVVNSTVLRTEDKDGIPTIPLRIPPLGVTVLCRAD